MIIKLYRNIYYRVFFNLRTLHYKLLSEIEIKGNKPKLFQPLLTMGIGRIIFDKNVVLGIVSSPFQLNGYSYIECRNKEAEVFIGEGTWCNNNFSIICEKTSVNIGNDARIGLNVCIMDSDFHNLDPVHRNSGSHIAKPVVIGKNVLIGNNVTILKGVRIGDNSIIASGAVVNINIPENSVAGGIPARVIGDL